MITTRNIGVAMDIAMMLLMTENSVIRNTRRDRGMVWSIMFTSLENLLRMRPRGVVSKNDMGALRTVLSMLLCRALEARKDAMAMEKAARNTKLAWENPKMAYMPR